MLSPSACVASQETVLDFYGVPIKAADIRAHVDRMSTLARRIGSLPDPHTQLQLPAAALPPLPKWSRAVAEVRKYRNNDFANGNV